MCGIAGYFSHEFQHAFYPDLKKAVLKLNKRGPDFQQTVEVSPTCGFGHARLSIIDTSSVAHQPMSDETGRFTIVFNGEIFNYRELKDSYLKNVHFRTSSDTEVLLYLYIKYGADCLPLLNGFFAFAVYDNNENSMFVARDRYGIKPLLYHSDANGFAFASEMKALLEFDIKRSLDYNSLLLYLQLNYVPGNDTMIDGVKRLKPGHYVKVEKHQPTFEKGYYKVPFEPGTVISTHDKDYDTVKASLKKLIEESVERRMVADVPLGAFLSGGIDSSIVTACASKFTKHLNTYSIGYTDNPYFDETRYAKLVADRHRTNHTVFSISSDEMFENIHDILEYIDEPFADSSAIAVYILCKKTRQEVTVALSGDGGDELFAGYNKHKAEWNIRTRQGLNTLIGLLSPVLKTLPQSRHGRWSNLYRQLNRYAEGLQLTPSERYWRWCILTDEQQAMNLLAYPDKTNNAVITARKDAVAKLVTESGDINDTLLADTQMVLPNDMLTKVDLMSMANSLEVRVPLLDYTVVNYAFSIPAAYKVNKHGTKMILKDAFRDELPEELFNRPKRGFEVPLLHWLKTGLHSLIHDDLLSERFIHSQGVFNYRAIEGLKKKLHSNNPGDVHATVWALVVFQYWYKKYMM